MNTLTRNLSAQIIYDLTGNARYNDGPSNHTSALIPEIRYYFRKTKPVNRAFFLGAYTQFAKKIITSGGEVIQDVPNEEQHLISPGLLIGESIHLGKRWRLEGFAGANTR
jgi:hypothetical protein